MNNIISIELDGKTDVHIACGVADYSTVCGQATDGDRDSGVVVPTARGAKITCGSCENIWAACRGFQRRSFANPLP